jgi:hypothetical protein
MKAATVALLSSLAASSRRRFDAAVHIPVRRDPVDLGAHLDPVVRDELLDVDALEQPTQFSKRGRVGRPVGFPDGCGQTLKTLVYFKSR